MTWQPDSFHSRRCETCDVNWPRATAFDECPGCDGYTESSFEQPLAAGPAADLVIYFRQEREVREAIRRGRHEAFKEYLAARDEPIVQELIAALDLLPTASAEFDDPPPRTYKNFGRLGGELG